MEILSIYFAAAVHDYDHPGVNNNFLISTQDPRALLYNDRSVLENHHCSSAFKVLRKPNNNFLYTLDNASFKIVRTHVVEMILATDLALHFDLLAKFKQKVIASGNFDPMNNSGDKSILMQVLMKCADVSNPTKEWSLYNEWINRITAEFHQQGDLEKEMGLEVSPFMNRENSSNGSNAQKGFIEFIVYPLFEALEYWTPISMFKHHLDSHRKKYCGVSAENDILVNEPSLIRTDFENFDKGFLPPAESGGHQWLSTGRRMSAYTRRPSLVQSARRFSLFQRSTGQSNAGLQSASHEIPNVSVQIATTSEDPFNKIG